MELSHLKAAYRIPAAWRDAGLAGTPGKCVPSPFRQDRSPSFSVFEDGTRWHDFATGEGGDVFDFVAKARACGTAGAIAWVKDRLGIDTQPKRPPLAKTGPRVPPLRLGTPEEHQALMEQRGFSIAGLKLAEQRGLLHFTRLWTLPAWAVTDQRRALIELRRLDGRPWPAFGRLSERKAHCVGTGKSWPIGTLESQPFAKVVMVEGAPDLLAVCHFIVVEGKTDTIGPVAVLGASNHRLAPEALAHFMGKRVCLYPHADDAGRKAVGEWARGLKAAGAARATAFDLSGLVLTDGTVGKDLADVCRIDADCYEREPKFREVLP